MTYQELYDILAQTGLPMALHHWEHPPKPPYGVYSDDYTDNFSADNIAYHVIQHVWVELYAPPAQPGGGGENRGGADGSGPILGPLQRLH